MKKKRGFKLKSGNNIVGKGKKPSNFKMMGASPAKVTGRYEFDVDEMGEAVPGSGRRITKAEQKGKNVLVTGQDVIDDAQAVADKITPDKYSTYAEYKEAKEIAEEGVETAKKAAKVGLKSDILPDIERNLTMSEDKRRQDIKNVQGDEYDAKEQERIRVKRILGYVPNRLK
tara:strand:- start:39 stop:554 length:516 start_codon:yes stop_codon:yes gene_type:complete